MKINYIKLLRVPKANWNYDLYLYFYNSNGITYTNNNYLIGTFKGTGNYIYPFKTEPDKGTKRPDYLYIMPFDDTRYCFASVNSGTSNAGYVKTYKYVWIDDTPNYNDLWNYTLGDSLYVSSSSTTSYVYHINDNFYNLILDRAIKTTTWEQGIWLVRMNGSSYIFSKMLIPYQIFNPVYYPPDIKGSYFAFQDTDNYTLTCYAKQDSAIAKIRFQRATDINFTNIVEDRLVDFSFDQSSFSKSGGTSYTIYETFFYGHPDYYVRVRYEDLAGNGGPWSRTVLWRTQDSADATFNEEWPFTGHIYTYNLTDSGFLNVNSKMVGVIKETDETYQNGTYVSSLTNYYLYVFDQDGNFIQRIGLPSDYNNTRYLYASNKKLFISYNDTNTWQPRLLIYDVDTNTYSVDSINLPPEYSMLFYSVFYKGNVYYIAYRTDSGADIVCYNPSSKSLEKVDLPNNMSYSMISQSFQDDGFWFDFDDGTYIGIAFAYISEEQKTMAFNFNQFIQNFRWR